MPTDMRLIRVAWDPNSLSFMVEVGELVKQQELTKEEKTELTNLRNQLEPYGDFMNLGELEEEEREKVFAAKGRRAELEEKVSKEEIIWTPKPEDEVKSVVLVLAPNRIPVYVENMPNEWIDKLFKSEITIESPQVFLGGPVALTPESEEKPGFIKIPGSDKLNRVRKCLFMIEEKPKTVHFKDADTYLDCVDVIDEENYVRVTPKRFLEDDWAPINEILKATFGDESQWTTEGRTSHWKVF